MVVLNLAGLDSSGAIGSSGNSSGTICFPGGSIMDVVGIQWSGIDV